MSNKSQCKKCVHKLCQNGVDRCAEKKLKKDGSKHFYFPACMTVNELNDCTEFKLKPKQVKVN